MAKFRADPADRSARVALDGLTALYHRPSGTTHILAAPAPQILDALAGAALDRDALVARLAAQFEIAGDAAELDARLGELEAAGLVARG